MAYWGDGRNHLKVPVGAFIALEVSCEVMISSLTASFRGAAERISWGAGEFSLAVHASPVVYFINGCSSKPHFLQYKKILKIITSLSLATAPLEQAAFLAAAQFPDLYRLGQNVISGRLPPWVAHPPAQTDGL
jgi:hypothetical protein